MKISSLEKSINVIETLMKYPNGLTLSNLSKAMNMSSSALHHILSTFKEFGYVKQEVETKKYSLGYRFVVASRFVLDSMDVRKVASPHLLALQQETDETTYLTTLRDHEVIYIDVLKASGKLSLVADIGWRLEAHSCTSGKVLLSGLKLDDFFTLYPEEELEQVGMNTTTSREKLLAQIKEIKKNGYLYTNEEFAEGVRSVSAPIFSQNRVVAAVTLTGSIFSLSEEKVQDLVIPAVVKTAKNISLAL